MYVTGSWSIVYALDAATGKQLWRYDPEVPGAVAGRACCDVVNRGVAWWGDTVDVGTLDGRLVALNAQTGEPVWGTCRPGRHGDLLWRFYTVPGDPSQPFESPAFEMAAKTWTGEWWLAAGGGTVWDAIVYDPELDLLYIGVGNGSPWERKIRIANCSRSRHKSYCTRPAYTRWAPSRYVERTAIPPSAVGAASTLSTVCSVRGPGSNA